ncbi:MULTISPECIES: metal-sulfur cluster assembly factor [Loigolactobacillus]|uniref:DNA methyltransferase n=1 Tax=Loigolactobacillus backii TaxID=375175 RepID=A0A192H0W1_9LACO|nr:MULTISPECIES: metal-sulfur cluster assembly factor [Loigolactobacillus]ANK60834.1 DNA methyltransferase [Loigolactobacillus backii]ANK61591.1 DNA methyltransferase [Loigolactobacillus backii]ANK65787.1 DNA methyltransferase [Loigolactobacillus backii]ANK68264.1 DNA methyltransferase [Loigolactobacillus backii]ANK69211.1 DNA methyltransferase [Loigolactobacillus backii]
MTETNTADNLKDRMLDALETVIDPELGCDIVNLGLIYGLSMTEDGECAVTMTLTTMGCPISDILEQMIDNALSIIPEVKKVKINLVWYPAWTVAKMSRYARISLGVHY